jgi:hypothetical protein
MLCSKNAIINLKYNYFTYVIATAYNLPFKDEA